MAGTAPQTEWYIARNGEQHGPLSDAEMGKFVELGHLRPTDLVWCAGFPDWRPADQVFAGMGDGQPLVTTATPAAVDVPEPAHDAGQGPASEAGAVRGAQSGRGLQQSISEMQGGSAGAIAQPAAGQAGHGQHAQGQHAASQHHHWQHPHGNSQPGSDQPGLGTFEGTEGRRPVGFGGGREVVTGQGQGQSQGLQARGGGAAAGREKRDGPPGAREAEDFYDDEYAYEPVRKNRFGRVAAVAAGLLIVGGIGWVAWQNASRLPDVSSIGSAVVAKVTREAPTDNALQHSPFIVSGAGREEIDGSLQKAAVWRTLKRDYKSWYDERIGDIERMRMANEDEKVVSKFLADVIVVLRRRNGQAALQSAPEQLAGMATAFLGNLKQLASRDAQTCYGFISYGEANAFMLELTKTPAFAEALQRQLEAVFGAISIGKKSPQIYQPAQRADYDALTAELLRRGWTQDDLAVFSDPRRLSRSPPEKVCSMVQDWFGAQLALKDPQVRSRLLAESLKPLVMG